MKTISAKFAGTCKSSGLKFEIGAEMMKDEKGRWVLTEAAQANFLAEQPEVAAQKAEAAEEEALRTRLNDWNRLNPRDYKCPASAVANLRNSRKVIATSERVIPADNTDEIVSTRSKAIYMGGDEDEQIATFTTYRRADGTTYEQSSLNY